MYSLIVPLFWVLGNGWTFVLSLFRVISDLSQQYMFKFLDEHLTNFFKGISLPSISAFPDSNYLINIRIFLYNDKYLKISL